MFYLSDAALLDREKLDASIEAVKAEGWCDVEVIEGYYSINDKFPGRIYPERRILSPDEEAALERLQASKARRALSGSCEISITVQGQVFLMAAPRFNRLSRAIVAFIIPTEKRWRPSDIHGSMTIAPLQHQPENGKQE